MQKSLILIRHGHRDNSRRELDNGLDAKGKEQARAIKQFFLDRFEPNERQSGLWIVSSPKLRCVETLSPLTKALDRQLDQHPDLDEQSSREGLAEVKIRVQGFLNEWLRSKSGITVVCSHGDWSSVASASCSFITAAEVAVCGTRMRT